MPALITLAARRPELGKAFNYASLIVNNHYFLAKLVSSATTCLMQANACASSARPRHPQ